MDRKKMWLSQSTDLDLLIYKGNEQKNHGFQLKYRFGFAYIYKGNEQKNHGFVLKYRFGFAYIGKRKPSFKEPFTAYFAMKRRCADFFFVSRF